MYDKIKYYIGKYTIKLDWLKKLEINVLDYYFKLNVSIMYDIVYDVSTLEWISKILKRIKLPKI